MRRAILIAALLAAPAYAMMGVLVGQSTTTVGGQMYTVCTYNVGGQTINQMIRGPAVCPPSINL
jgi:hypothetical protein